MLLIDDSIMQKDKPATAGSAILESFIAPFDATVVTRLKNNSIAIDGSIVLPEFGLSAPDELPDAIILCNDIFGYVRRQADAQGMCYIRPAYGTVSRYGLIPVATSMDQIGIVCKDPIEGFDLLSVIAGHDEKDGAMTAQKKYSYNGDETQLRKVEEMPPYAEVYEQVMMILAYAEINNNTNRYDGIKYGVRVQGAKGLEELYTKTRTELLGKHVKLAAVMGCMVLSANQYKPLYDKAMRIRRKIKESFEFDKYDVYCLPPDSHAAVLCGLPSLTFSGCQWVTDAGNENALLTVWRKRNEI
jgi:aspartyl-tRNA(Asn)/glutamyl-tRNA(Gln) amidotransferase subunit A